MSAVGLRLVGHIYVYIHLYQMNHARLIKLLDKKKTKKKHCMVHINPSRDDKGCIPYHPCAVNTSES